MNIVLGLLCLFVLAFQASMVSADIILPDWEELEIVRTIQGNNTKLLRAYDSAKLNHRYYLNDKARQTELSKIKTMVNAGDIGYVVSYELYKAYIQQKCKTEMKRMNVYFHKTNRRVEIVAKSLPAKTYTKHGSFWCATSYGTCGAKWELQYLTRVPCLNKWKDFWYPKSKFERDDWIEKMEDYGKKATATGCYIWTEQN